MSLKKKLYRIKNHEDFKQVDGLLIKKPENVLYILGFKIESDTLIYIPNEDSKQQDSKLILFLNQLEYDQAKKNVDNDGELSNIINMQLIPMNKPKFVEKTINKLNLNSIGFEDDFISVKKYDEWKKKFKIPDFIGLSNAISKARVVKTAEEIERMKEAAKLGDIGFRTIYDSIQDGMSETELAAEAEYAMRKSGSEGTSFETIVATGTKSAFPHAKTSERKILDGDIILVDIGAKFKGYCSDMTRTFIHGSVDSERAKLINLVNEGQQLALDSVRDGLDCSNLDKIVRDFFIRENPKWGERFIHSLGHGVGIDIHESPYISSVSQEKMEENMVFTVEPGLYIPELGGARTEDLIVIEKKGCVSLTQSKKYYY